MNPTLRKMMLHTPQGIVKNGLVAHYKFNEGAGQSLYNSVLTPTSIENLVSNGNFADTTGWVGNSATVSAASNTLTVTGDGASATPSADQLGIVPWVENKKIYARCKFKVTNSNCTYVDVRAYVTGMATAVAVLQSSPSINTQYEKSGILTLGSGGSGDVRFQAVHRYADAATANGKVMEVQEVFAADLTAIFGAGNEPTAEQCDRFFLGWFDGTRTLDVPLYNGTLGSASGSDTNDPTWGTDGLSFTTDDRVLLPKFALTELTMIAVCKTTDATIANQTVMYEGKSQLALAFKAAECNFIQVGIADHVFDTISNNEIVFLAGVRDSANKLTMWKNNTSYTAFCVNSTATNDSYIGFNPTGGHYLSGNVYYALYYNRALLDKEIKQNYRAIKAELAKRGVAVA